MSTALLLLAIGAVALLGGVVGARLVMKKAMRDVKEDAKDE